jgi:hypothetical protein
LNTQKYSEAVFRGRKENGNGTITNGQAIIYKTLANAGATEE